MKYHLYASTMAVLLCLFLMSGCPKKEEPMQAQTPLVQAEPAPAPAPQVNAGSSQIERARQIHKDFVGEFSQINSKEETAETLRSSLDLVEKARTSCMLLRADVQDQAAQDYVIRFADVLQRYLDLGKQHLATLDEEARQYAAGKELEAALPKLPDKERADAAARLKSLVTKHNELVQGPLKTERDELKALGDGLIGFK